MGVRSHVPSARRGFFNFIIRIFFMWAIFKVFIESVTTLLLLYVLVFLAARHVGS